MMRAIQACWRNDTGENYRQMLFRMARESGIKTPTTEELTRMDKKRKGKKLSNQEWESPVDPDARVARMKDGRTRLGYKPEHAVDLETGVIVAAVVHPADQGDTTTLEKTLDEAGRQLQQTTPTPPCPEEKPSEGAKVRMRVRKCTKPDESHKKGSKIDLSMAK